MFHYRCPGCGKHHAVDKEFAQLFEAKCLRCGALISVTPELARQSQGAARSSVSLSAPVESITNSVGVASRSGVLAKTSAEEPALDAPSLPDDLAEVEPRKNGRDNSKEQTANKEGKPLKKKPAKQAEKPEEQEEEEKKEAAPKVFRGESPTKEQPGAKGPRPRWQLIAGVSAAVLVLFITVGYLVFGGKKTESKKPAKSAAKPVPAKPSPPPPVQVVKKADPPIKIAEAAQLILSAPRLSAELAADTDLANRKYAGKFIEVSGLFAKMESREGLHPPARPHAVFATSGTPVCCDLEDSSPPASAWNRLKSNQPFTIRGNYEKNGYLRGCFLMPEYTSTADSRYKGRVIEVAGRVEKTNVSTDGESFPTVILAGETISVMQIHCLFRTTDAAEVRALQSGTPVTIQGTCGGRQGAAGGGNVRLDNCRLVYTSAPPEKVPRLDAIRLLREYEEDVRPDYLPPPGEEEQIDTIWTIRQLVKDYSANPKAFLGKCRYHLLRVQGKLQPIAVGKQQSVVVLTSGDTDLTFQVECYLRPDEIEVIRRRREPAYRLRGLFTGKIDDKKLRLDNCQLDMPRTPGPSLTEDYLPHKRGRAYALDVATFDTLIQRKLGIFVQREVHVQEADGVTEILVTHAGPLLDNSLFEDGAQQKWVEQNKVRIRRPETNAIYFRRLHAGFIELGTPHPGLKGTTEIAWIPMLKLHTQAGDRWKWEPPNGPHEFVLEKFDDFQGQPCAVIREMFTPAADVLHPIETLHVYAKGFGEVERRQWRHLDQRGHKKTLTEMKWVGPVNAEQEAIKAVKPAGKPPRKPSAPVNGKPALPRNK